MLSWGTPNPNPAEESPSKTSSEFSECVSRPSAPPASPFADIENVRNTLSYPHPEPPPRRTKQPRRRFCSCKSCLGWLVWIVSVLLVGTALPMMGIDPPRLRFEMEEMFADWWFADRLTLMGRKGKGIPIGGDGLLSPDEIRRVVRHSYPEVEIFATDAAYLTPTVDDIKTFLRESTAKDYTYTEERHDCDDFAQILQGELRQYEYYLHNNRSWAFGQAFGPLKTDATQLHAFNMFIGPSHRLWLVEPQTNEIASVGEFEYGVTSVFI